MDSLRPPDLSCCTKTELKEYFENSYDLNESLFTSLRDESVFYVCPDRLRLPLVFYFAHTASVYINKLMLAGLIQERVNLEFETLFETGVDEMSWDDTENYRMGGTYQWPSLDKVIEYRRSVRNVILKVIQDTSLELPITMDSHWWALVMGIEHERIHVETSSVLIRQLPIAMVTKPDGWVYGPIKHGEKVKDHTLITVESQEVTLGKPENFPSFGWDNEYGATTYSVPSFEASKFPVTNGQFLEFVKAGGYRDQTYWTSEGWEWRSFRQASHPAFWVCDKGCKSGCGAALSSYSHCTSNGHVINNDTNDVSNGPVTNGDTNGVGNGHVTNGDSNGVRNGDTNGVRNVHVTNAYSNGPVDQCEYRYRAMFNEINMPLDWPVDVNYHESRAYCVWRGSDFRIPTEAEYKAMRGSQLSPDSGVKYDVIFQENASVNNNLAYGSSTPVNLYPASDLGFHDLDGNVFEWTEDHLNGFHGYRTHFLYDDYSSPCLEGRHNVMVGGSWISTGTVASIFARYGFRRHFMQHCGFRLVRPLTSGDGKLDIPVASVEMELFVLGAGEEDIPETIDTTRYSLNKVGSANPQFLYDKGETLEGILDQEFGYRDALPCVVAVLCGHYTRTYRCGTSSAVWFGAGSGRGPTLLAKKFGRVLAVDYSARFVDACLRQQRGEALPYTDRNGCTAMTIIDRENYSNRVSFKQFSWIPNEIGKHNLVVVTFLERTSNPKAWLVRLWEIVQQSGIIVIVSGGRVLDRDTLGQHLDSRLKCVCVQEVPFENCDGKTNAIATVWTLK